MRVFGLHHPEEMVTWAPRPLIILGVVQVAMMIKFLVQPRCLSLFSSIIILMMMKLILPLGRKGKDYICTLAVAVRRKLFIV